MNAFHILLMALLSSLYDAGNEKYPIYHSGILAFVVTICLPLNIGISRLPVVDVLALLLGGFFSLFMLARNEKVGLSLLSHLRIPQGEIRLQFDRRLVARNMTRPKDNEWLKADDFRRDPFVMLENAVEHIMITHDEHIDLPTREMLENMQQRLRKITEEICKA